MAESDNRETACAENVQRLSTAIAALRSDLQIGRVADFWRGVKGVSQLFREAKALRKTDRDRLWAEFDVLCQQAKNEQARTRERRDEVSRQKSDLVQHKLNDAYHQAKGATSTSELKVAGRLLAEALSWMKPGWSQVSVGDDLVHLNDGRLNKDDHDVCWARWKEVKETIDWRWREFKEQWAHKQETERARRIERINKAKSVIRQLEGQIDHCRDLQRGAKSWEFESRVQGWIDEKEAKIRDIEESIRRDEDVIADIDRRLSR
jgi:hypothetical protein